MSYVPVIDISKIPLPPTAYYENIRKNEYILHEREHLDEFIIKDENAEIVYPLGKYFNIVCMPGEPGKNRGFKPTPTQVIKDIKDCGLWNPNNIIWAAKEENGFVYPKYGDGVMLILNEELNKLVASKKYTSELNFTELDFDEFEEYCSSLGEKYGYGHNKEKFDDQCAWLRKKGIDVASIDYWSGIYIDLKKCFIFNVKICI